MDGFADLLKDALSVIANGGTRLLGWIGVNVNDIRSLLKKLKIWGLSGTFAGLLISALSYQAHFDWGVSVGRVITHLTALFIAYCFLSIWIRAAMIGIPVGVITRWAVNSANRVSQASPVVPDLDIPEPLSQEAERNLLREIMAVMTWFMFIAAYTSVVPAYTDLTRFLVCLVLATFLAMATYAWKLEDTIHLKEKAAWAAGIMLVINTALLITPVIVPQKIQDIYALHQAKQQADHRIAEGYKADMEKMNVEREHLARIPSYQRSVAEQARLSQLNMEFDRMKWLNDTSSSPIEPEGMESVGKKKGTQVFVLASLVLLALVIYSKT